MEWSLRIELASRWRLPVSFKKGGTPTVLKSGPSVFWTQISRLNVELLCRVSGSECGLRDCELCLKGVLIDGSRHMTIGCHMKIFQKPGSRFTMNKMRLLKPCTPYIQHTYLGSLKSLTRKKKWASWSLGTKSRTQSDTAEEVLFPWSVQ